jgi:hypothetical protein
MLIICLAGGPCEPTREEVEEILFATCWAAVVDNDEFEVEICRNANVIIGSKISKPNDNVISNSMLD